MKIYTKTGDKGTTSLLSGKRVKKDHLRLDCYGSIDELNSSISLILDYGSSPKPKLADHFSVLRDIQHFLFNIGSHLACDDEAFKKHIPPLSANITEVLENKIDQMNEEVPELKNFIIPGGSFLSSLCHNSRCICRRAERITCKIEEDDITNFAIPLLNRLSDYLFCLARYINFLQDIKDIDWDKNKV